MEDLFRFLLTRPAQSSDPNTRTVPIRPSRDYLQSLREARQSNDPRAALKSVAQTQAQSPTALTSVNALSNATPLRELLKALGAGADKTLVEMQTLVRNLFNRPATEVVADSNF